MVINFFIFYAWNSLWLIKKDFKNLFNEIIVFPFFLPSECLSSDNKLYIVFNVFDDESTSWTYQEGILSMKVTRKGSVISTLDADWLELTTFYYKQGLSLIDSFVCWETSKGKFYIMIYWYLKNWTLCQSWWKCFCLSSSMAKRTDIISKEIDSNLNSYVALI